MDIETLYPLVTEAIRRAEILDELGAPGAFNAHRDVSLLEEKIAELIPASETEGAIARRGAVRASTAAGEFIRAQELAARYALVEGTSNVLKRELRQLAKAAQDAASSNGQLDAGRYPGASKIYGIADIRRVISAFQAQGAPLPIC